MSLLLWNHDKNKNIIIEIRCRQSSAYSVFWDYGKKPCEKKLLLLEKWFFINLKKTRLSNYSVLFKKLNCVSGGLPVFVTWILVTAWCNERCKKNYCELMDDLIQSDYLHISCFHPDKKMCLKQWLKYTLQSLKQLIEVFFQTYQQQKQQLKLQ